MVPELSIQTLFIAGKNPQIRRPCLKLVLGLFEPVGDASILWLLRLSAELGEYRLALLADPQNGRIVLGRSQSHSGGLTRCIRAGWA